MQNDRKKKETNETYNVLDEKNERKTKGWNEVLNDIQYGREGRFGWKSNRKGMSERTNGDYEKEKEREGKHRT